MYVIICYFVIIHHPSTILLFQHTQVKVFNKADEEPSNPSKHLLVQSVFIVNFEHV